MSLINDALKKAQKQRTGEVPTLASMPSIGGEPAQRIARRAKPAGFNSLLIRAGISAGVLVLVAGGWVAFREKPETGDRKSEVSQPQTASPTVNPPVLIASPPGSTPTSAPVFTVAVKAETPPPMTKPEAKPVALPPATPPGATKFPPAPAAEPAPPAPAPKLEPRAIHYIENIRVAGIRASANDSKVLMNDRVYRAGDIVEHEMGLKLIGITANSLTFEDERGGRYTRNF